MFVVTAAFQAHPGLAAGFAASVWRPALSFAQRQDVALLDSLDTMPRARIDIAPPGPNDARTLAHVTLPPLPRGRLVDDHFREPEFSASVTVLIAPDLSPEDLARLGERFWRKSAAREASNHGGLGLALSGTLAGLLGLRLDFTLERAMLWASLGPLRPIALPESPAS